MPGKRATFTPWTVARTRKMNNMHKVNTTKITMTLNCVLPLHRGSMVQIKVNTTKINRKQSPDTGIEPETSDMPGKRATFTPWTEHHA